MSASDDKCRDCRQLARGRCLSCRQRNNRHQIIARIRSGRLRTGKCWRCLGVHPIPTRKTPRKGGRDVEYFEERFCPLAAEYNEWNAGESDTGGWVYPEGGP